MIARLFDGRWPVERCKSAGLSGEAYTTNDIGIFQSFTIVIIFYIFVSMNPVIKNIDKIKQACLEHNIEQLFIFGSVNTDKFNEQSDVDILVQFNSLVDPLEYFNNYMDFKENLESILGREVDIVENQAVRNPIFRRILDRDKQLIYERKSA